MELTRVLDNHERDVFVADHAPASGYVRQVIGPSWAELQAVRESGSRNLIQRVDDVLSISVDPMDPDSIERRKAHLRDRGEPSTFGASPAARDCGNKVPQCLDESCGGHIGIDRHAARILGGNKLPGPLSSRRIRRAELPRWPRARSLRGR